MTPDAQHRQWCAYAEESTWKRAIDASSGTQVATAEYVDGRLTVVSVTEVDEAGDWAVFDRYFMNVHGQPDTLERTINILPGDASIKRTYRIEKGVAKEESSLTKQLSTGRPTLPFRDWLPDLPVLTYARSFPFFELLGTKHLEVWKQGKLCTQITSPGGRVVGGWQTLPVRPDLAWLVGGGGWRGHESPARYCGEGWRVAGPLGGGEGTNLLRGNVAGGGPFFRPWFGRKGGALRSHSRRSLPRS